MPKLDTIIRSTVRRDSDDLGSPDQKSVTHSANVRIEYTDEDVTIFGLGLYPQPMARHRIIRLEAYAE